MKRTGQIDLPLHSGKAPRWLFEKMVNLSRYISEAIIIEYGKDYFLERLSNPEWFQCFGACLGFDWHSSGITTTVCGALKEAFKDLEDYGVYFCGGKAKSAMKTPHQIEKISQRLSKDPKKLVYASKIVAKIDNNALQDGFNLYHHTFIFTSDDRWVVIQQGMSKDGWARRYHWYSQKISSFVEDPHQGIYSEKSYLTLNLVDKDTPKLREIMVDLSGRNPEQNLKEFMLLRDTSKLPKRHYILLQDINPKFLEKTFLRTYQAKAKDFEDLLSLEGVGAKTLRALSLISDLIFGSRISFKDPARFSFAHGGKDGYPYRIKLKDYNKTLEMMEKVINKAKIERSDKVKSLRRLYTALNVKLLHC
jgi:hypothetical protein